ncbi:SAM-dependent methyltransferase [Sphaerisporangium melleum]|uniref:SAM-dependent methyltransferase n=1 Tax=Sphaerisporangium melleum TaxID=321316 RepID=A0A917R876_9ACTN|nr:SAM-dependent methyltransferase [Sphaerisporangium melleum]GGK94104.1 SAM-dependent methyltransferase [Sphaerisporangium melleum]GII73198.1 SAM-dependent methyltransferase [Sphaerisporangium melleum]
MAEGEGKWGCTGDEQIIPPEIDTTNPSIARVYDYFLDGKDNFAVDRQVAEMALRIVPDAKDAGKANRRFLRRVVRYLAAEEGIRQFIDLGSGLPTQGNVHQIAQEIDPAAQVVYVDNDPIVLVHGRALLATNGSTTVIQADVRDPEAIYADPALRGRIDFSKPIGLLLFSILHHLNDEEDPWGIAERLREPLPSGSFIAMSNFFNAQDEHPEASKQAVMVEKLFNENLGTGRWRTREEIMRYLGDMELVEPGLVPLADWRPDAGESWEKSATYYTYAGCVARKP